MKTAGTKNKQRQVWSNNCRKPQSTERRNQESLEIGGEGYKNRNNETRPD